MAAAAALVSIRACMPGLEALTFGIDCLFVCTDNAVGQDKPVCTYTRRPSRAVCLVRKLHNFRGTVMPLHIHHLQRQQQQQHQQRKPLPHSFSFLGAPDPAANPLAAPPLILTRLCSRLLLLPFPVCCCPQARCLCTFMLMAALQRPRPP